MSGCENDGWMDEGATAHVQVQLLLADSLHSQDGRHPGELGELGLVILCTRFMSQINNNNDP